MAKTILEIVKDNIRLSGTDLDETEVTPLIEACVADLKSAGVSAEKANDDADPLIKQAIILYCKANFGYEDSAIAERFQELYDLLKSRLSVMADYQEVIA